MTALIIEDEIPASIRMRRILESKDFVVVEQIQSVRKAVSWFETNSHPEVVFMDIKLSDGDAFSIFDKVKIKSKIVFTTAYDEFALKAFENKGIAYLLKPIDEKKLDVLLATLEYHKSVFNINDSKITDNKSYLMVSFGSTLKKIDIDDIMSFYSADNATFILSKEKRSYSIPKSLEKLEGELNTELFYRINRSVMVNRNYVEEVKNHLVIMKEKNLDLDLKISRNRQNGFKEWYK
ncbi:LytTR family DNA-binding domain-containing protein [Flavobacterium enshiense]|uniref:LytR/AlgR family response regulator transcription factor n=1 Tax=Flavobacterium enshiense TaxID=1341165 RepID=UPI00345DD1E8